MDDQALLMDVGNRIFARLGQDSGLAFFSQYFPQFPFTHEALLQQAAGCIRLASQSHPFDWGLLDHSTRVNEAGAQWRPLAIGFLTELYGGIFQVSAGQAAAWATSDVDEPVDLSGAVQRRMFTASQSQALQSSQHQSVLNLVPPRSLTIHHGSVVKLERKFETKQLAAALAKGTKKVTLQCLYHSLRGNHGGGRSKQELAEGSMEGVNSEEKLRALLRRCDESVVGQLFEDLFPAQDMKGTKEMVDKVVEILVAGVG